MAEREQRDRQRNAEEPAHDLAGASPGLRPAQSLLGAALMQRKIARRLAARKAAAGGPGAEATERVEAAAHGATGAPLPETLKGRFEGSLGADLSSVRVHTSEASARAADAVSAQAYTIGSDVHFAAGKYDPSSRQGQHLLAHEVAHTVQQAGATSAPQYRLDVSEPGDAAEVQADRAADAMVEGAPASVGGAGGATLARNPEAGAGATTGGETQAGQGAKDAKAPMDPVEHTAVVIEMYFTGEDLFDWDGGKDAVEIIEMLARLSQPQRRQVLQRIGPASTGRLTAHVPADKAHLFAGLIPGEDKKAEAKPLDEEIKAAPNAEQAAIALGELRAKQAGEKADPRRLTDGIIELLVWGVARPMFKDDKSKKGVLGIDQAGNAADALVAMPLEAYLQIVSKLIMTGGDEKADAKLESLLILKAVGARKSEFSAGDKKAAGDVDKFAEAIRGREAEQLKADTSLAEHDGKEKGLQQKYTMSCGPTSIQITHGEVDPVFALEVSEKAKHNLDYKSDVATQQKDYLGKPVVPREVEDDRDKFTAWWKTLPPTDKPKVAALEKWIQGKAADATLRADGAALANAAGWGDARLDEFKKYFALFGNAPGWGNSDFASKANAELGGATGGKFDERPIPPKYQAIIKGGSKVFISTVKVSDVDALWNKLFRGTPVPMGIMWTNGGGHFMVFTDCRKQDDGSGKQLREFLLSDPWDGKSAWITEANVIKSDLSPFGKGAIDSLYL